MVLRDLIQGACKTQPQVIAIQGHPLDLPENLREVHGRSAHLRGDFRERPASGQVAGQQNFSPIRQPVVSMASLGCVRRARSQTPTDQGQRQTLGLQRLDGMVTERMAKERHQCLGARIDSLVLSTEAQWRLTVQQGRRHELAQKRFRKNQHQAGIAPIDRMTDLISLTGVEEQHMIRIGDCLVATDVTDVDPSVRKHQLRFRGTLVRTAMTTRAAAQDVSNRYGIRRQQMVYLKFRHCRHFTPIVRQTSAELRFTEARRMCESVVLNSGTGVPDDAMSGSER
jgi:hypothetical protein